MIRHLFGTPAIRSRRRVLVFDLTVDDPVQWRFLLSTYRYGRQHGLHPVDARRLVIGEAVVFGYEVTRRYRPVSECPSGQADIRINLDAVVDGPVTS